MKHNLPLEVNSPLASQEILCLLWNQNFYCFVHIITLLDCIWNHHNQV
jgi:hypothetical protein